MICTETAKGFLSKVEFNPWEQKNYDRNDTVIDSHFYQDFLANYPDNPTEEQRNEKDALDKAAEFYDTPVISYLDSLGNTFLVNDNGLTSCYKYDIQGRLIESVDPRLYAANLSEGTAYYNFKYLYPMMGDAPWVTDSTDGGVNLSFNNVFGNHLWNRSPRNFDQVIYYDELQRNVKIRTQGIKNDRTIATDNVVETFIYGESQPNAKDYNLRGKLYQLRDQSGVVTNSKYNLQGNILETSRQLTKNYQDYVNWDDSVELEEEIYTNQFTFNAIQQLIAETTPDGSVKTNNYNLLGLLEEVKVTLPDGTLQSIINHIEYDAKGQRVAVSYDNGVNTTYTYEETTFRLIKLHSTRSSRDSTGIERKSVLQDIAYTYDPVGNITRLKDNTHATIFHNNQIVEPLSDYTYDAQYRLIKANGRKHPGINARTYQNNGEEGDFKQSKFVPLSDSNALENYQESYTYDDAGNLIKTTHTASNSWTRTNEIMPDSNRLKTVSSNHGFIEALPITYDRSGNQRQLHGNSTVQLTFNCCENLVQALIIERENQPDDIDYYTYDSEEMRTRKVSERLVNGGAVIQKESKIYFGNYEVKRLHNQTENGETTILKRRTLRVMDGDTCVAIFHDWEQDDLQREVDKVGTRKLRFTMGNHLGCVALEVDDDAQIISYEEYFPYGGTAFIVGRSQREVKLKEYRYSGKERDDSTGLYYYGARYYAPWLGRWLKPDPAGTVDGLNLYGFVGGNPLNFTDADGLLKRPAGPPPPPKIRREPTDQEKNEAALKIQKVYKGMLGRRQAAIEAQQITPYRSKMHYDIATNNTKSATFARLITARGGVRMQRNFRTRNSTTEWGVYNSTSRIAATKQPGFLHSFQREEALQNELGARGLNPTWKWRARARRLYVRTANFFREAVRTTKIALNIGGQGNIYEPTRYGGRHDMRSNSAWMLGLAHNGVRAVMTAKLDDETLVRNSARHGPVHQRNTDHNFSALGREVLGMVQNDHFRPVAGSRNLQELVPTATARTATLESFKTPKGMNKAAIRTQLNTAGVDVSRIT